jgi:PAS domain S-box-containing protein
MSDLKKILIIDDEVAIRLSFADYLEDRNFKVIMAENGRIGLELVQKEQPDIILVDLLMPEVSGLEVLKQTQKIAPDTPKVVISGGNQIGDVVQALRYGAWDYLIKPVKDLSILMHSIDANLEKVKLLKENQTYQKHLESMVQKRTHDLNEAFDKVKASEKLYKTLFEKTNDAIFIIEQNTSKYLDANAAAAQLTGRTIEELKTLTCRDILPEGADERFEIFAKLDTAKEMGQETYHRPDGSFKIAKLSVVPMDDNAVIAIARDITHDLEMEKQLRHSQKMEAIGTLAGGIAHDFNNILSGILGYAQLTRMNLDDPGKTQQSLDQMVQGAERAAGLVQQILTFSRQIEHKTNPLKLFLIIKEAIKFLRSSIPSNIEIEEKIESRAAVLADPVQVHQVVMNLCTNAYHAMRDSGGILTVELTEIEITTLELLPTNSYSPGLYLKLEVKDTGHGIPKATLDKIFDPYFSTKQPDKGTGLGLAVVNGIVKKHNGFIKAYSEVNQGSTFQVFWPVINKQESLRSQNMETADLIKGTEQIMLVDDENDILNVSKLILEEHGYHVSTFMDGTTAFEAFVKNSESFDIIITDMAMPRMTGSELSAKILDIRNDIPIILCTGYCENFDEKMALSLGIKKYVQKPITGNNLAIFIRELLDNQE